MNKLIFIILIIFFGFQVAAQTDSGSVAIAKDTTRASTRVKPKPVKRRTFTDSTRRAAILDSTRLSSSTNRDSATPAIPDSGKAISPAIIVKPPVIKKPFDSFYKKLLDNPFLRTTAKPIYLITKEHKRQGKDEVFYLLSGLLLFLAFIKLAFSKYFSNLFRLFVQPTFRQKQTREQLQQSNLPSFLLNLFFVFSAATYASFLIEYYQLVDINYWFILLYAVASLLVLYTGKFIFLTFAGWVFNVKEATDSYIFAVYLINKILGIILIPFTLILAFSSYQIVNISITISLLIIFLLFIYRFILSYAPVRKEVKVDFFHFIFYILAFEIIPLLLIYKTLIIYLNKSA